MFLGKTVAAHIGSTLDAASIDVKMSPAAQRQKN